MLQLKIGPSSKTASTFALASTNKIVILFGPRKSRWGVFSRIFKIFKRVAAGND
jgi:hypothetical protein